jgi:hypothetical protein
MYIKLNIFNKENILNKIYKITIFDLDTKKDNLSDCKLKYLTYPSMIFI